MPAENITIDGVSAVAALVIAAFAVDRFASFCLFCLSLSPSFRRCCPEPQKGKRAVMTVVTADECADDAGQPLQNLGVKLHRVVYFVLAGIGAACVAMYGDMGILEVLGFKRAHEHHYFDMALTVLILTAGADRVAGLLQLSGVSGSQQADDKPIEITGTLTIDGNTEQLAAKVDGVSGQSES